MSEVTRPLLAITMGDPAGIGPEIVLKALAHADIFERCRPFVIGDRRSWSGPRAGLDNSLSSTLSRTPKRAPTSPGA